MPRSATHIVHYPELIKLVLEILILCPERLGTSAVLPHVLLRLIAIAKQSFHIASALYGQVSHDVLEMVTKGTIYILLWRGAGVNFSKKP